MVWLKGCTLYVYSTKLNIFTFFVIFNPFLTKKRKNKGQEENLSPSKSSAIFSTHFTIIRDLKSKKQFQSASQKLMTRVINPEIHLLDF